MTNPVLQFKAELEAAFGPLDWLPIPSGEPQRFHVPGDRPGSKNGWYILQLTGIPRGSFGSWKKGGTSFWSSRRPVDYREEQAISMREKEAKNQRETERRQVQQTALIKTSDKWNRATPADPSHPYLIAKDCKPLGLRQLGSELLIPLYLVNTNEGQGFPQAPQDWKRVLVNLQRIRPDSTKRFLPGGQVKGCYSPIGQLGVGQPIYICEGWATGATIHEFTGAAVACAMNAGNLLAVGEQLRLAYPDNPLIVAGDDDRQTTGNPGRTAAVKAASMLGCELILPPWIGAEPKELSDFNDLQRWREANYEQCT